MYYTRQRKRIQIDQMKQSPGLTIECCLYREDIPVELRHIICAYRFQTITDDTIHIAVSKWCKRKIEALEIYGHISHWKTSAVTDMSDLFALAEIFNDPIEEWDVSNVTNMSSMFSQAHNFNQSLSKWNVSNVTNMGYMFEEAYAFNQPLHDWNVNRVESMSLMFYCAYQFNQPLHTWKVDEVLSMERMFAHTKEFNQPLNQWQVCNVITMSGMFKDTHKFNQPLNDWNVETVIRMDEMFCEAKIFNQILDNWNVKNVMSMEGMFENASAYRHSLSTWSPLQVECFTLRMCAQCPIPIGTVPLMQNNNKWTKIAIKRAVKTLCDDKRTSDIVYGPISDWGINQVIDITDPAFRLMNDKERLVLQSLSSAASTN